MSLMAAKILQGCRDTLRGNVKFMFQPAEEGPGGAMPMIKAGLLRNPKVDAALAIHMWNELPLGKIGVREGPVFAAVDEFTLDVRGRGGHGAAPHQTKDPIVIAADIVTSLQTIISRRLDPTKPGVVTVGKIEGGTKFNIIPDNVKLYGTVRSFEPGIRKLLRREVERVVNGIAGAHGGRVDIDYKHMYPATVNNERMTGLVRKAAVDVVGKKNVVMQDISMGAEDMSYVLERVPGCYVVLGSSNPKKGLDAPHHSPRFNFDEDALPIGIDLIVKTAERFLNR